MAATVNDWARSGAGMSWTELLSQPATVKAERAKRASRAERMGVETGL